MHKGWARVQQTCYRWETDHLVMMTHLADTWQMPWHTTFVCYQQTPGNSSTAVCSRCLCRASAGSAQHRLLLTATNMSPNKLTLLCRVVVSVSTSRSRDVPTSCLGLVSRKTVNVLVSRGRCLGHGHLRLMPKTNFFTIDTELTCTAMVPMH